MARGAAHSVVGGHHRIEEQLPPERYSFSCQRIVGGNGRDQVETERSRSLIPVNRVTADENGERSNGERGAAHDLGQSLGVPRVSSRSGASSPCATPRSSNPMSRMWRSGCGSSGLTKKSFAPSRI